MTATEIKYVVDEKDELLLDENVLQKNKSEEQKENKEFKLEIVWPNVAWYIGLHIGAVFGLILLIFEAKWITLLWSELISW